MHINAVSSINYKRKNPDYRIAFSGINKESIESFSQDDGKSAGRFVDFFSEEIKKIHQKWHERRLSITGLFSGWQKKNISESEAIEMKRLIKDQRYIIEALRKQNQIAKQYADALKEAGESEKEKITLDRRLIQMKKAQQRTAVGMEELWKIKNGNTGFDSIGGYLQEKCILNDLFVQKLPLEIAGENVDIPNAILFFGPTGCGKTSFAKALADESKCVLDKVGTRRAPTTKKFINNFWEELMEKAALAEERFQKSGVRTILLIDDLDVVFGEKSPIIPDLNAFMQSCSKDYHTTLFITTNNPLSIPSATRNNRRIPIKVSLDAPNKADIAEILRLYLQRGDKNKNDIDYNSVAEVLAQKVNGDAYACSQIEDICKELIMSGKDKISEQNILSQAKKTKRGISKTQLEKFRKEVEQLNVVGVRE